jgi:hypothetical protein
MQLIIPNIPHAKTRYAGRAWPSVCNVAKWSFDIMRDEVMWVLGHGWGMVSEWVGPMVRYDEEKWRVWW